VELELKGGRRCQGGGDEKEWEREVEMERKGGVEVTGGREIIG